LWVAKGSVAAWTAGAQAEGVADTIELRLACVVVIGVAVADESMTGATALAVATANTAPRTAARNRAPPRVMMSFRSGVIDSPAQHNLGDFPVCRMLIIRAIATADLS
jgi:hypothetical protein